MPTYNGFSNDVIMTFGDSITEFGLNMEINGWVTQIATHYTRKFDLVHRGFAAYNTRWAKTVLKNILPETTGIQEAETKDKIDLKGTDLSLSEIFKQELSDRQPAKIRLLTIFFGANDAAIPGNKQHVPLDEYKSNLSEMINLIQDPQSKYHNNDTKIVLITPPVLCEGMWIETLKGVRVFELNRSNDRAKIYSDAAAEVGNRHGVAVVDLWNAFNDKIQEIKSSSDGGAATDSSSAFTEDKSSPYFAYDQLLGDGLHPNKGGNDLIASKVMEAINTHYPELNPDNLEFRLPLWPDIVEYTERTEGEQR